MMEPPVVGDIVHYYAGFDDVRLHKDSIRPYAAIVTDVHGNKLINICAFGHDGYPHPRFGWVVPLGVNGVIGRNDY
jgi:hypothetical protein